MINYLYLLIGINLFLFIYVSGNKNKMGFCKFSPITNEKSEKSNPDNFRLAGVSDDLLF